jgi:hypothetical protein
MSKKSLQSIQKEIVMNDHTPLRERVKTLKQMECPSERFLRTILDSDAPDELRRVAASRLVGLLSAAPKSTTINRTSLPNPAPKPEAPEKKTEVSNQGNVQVIDPEVWDMLGGFNGHPGYVRGPDPVLVKKEQLPESADPKLQAHTWRDALPERKENE